MSVQFTWCTCSMYGMPWRLADPAAQALLKRKSGRSAVLNKSFKGLPEQGKPLRILKLLCLARRAICCMPVTTPIQ